MDENHGPPFIAAQRSGQSGVIYRARGRREDLWSARMADVVTFSAAAYSSCRVRRQSE
jgi:hypothetical protein